MMFCKKNNIKTSSKLVVGPMSLFQDNLNEQR